MKIFKTRHQFFLPDDLSEKLETLAGKPGSSKTAILTDALRAWLERKAGHELDQRFGPRLDRQNRTADQTMFKVEALAETLNLFIQFEMTLAARQPPIDQATGQLGLKHYRQFMDQVAQRLAGMQAARAIGSAGDHIGGVHD